MSSDINNISHYDAGRIGAEFLDGICRSKHAKTIDEFTRLQLTLLYIHLQQMNKRVEATELGKLFGFEGLHEVSK